MLCQCQRVCKLHDLLPGKRAARPRPAEAGEAHSHAGACPHRLEAVVTPPMEQALEHCELCNYKDAGTKSS